MSTLPPRVVLDASAVLAWVLHEPGWKTVNRLLSVSAVPASAMVECLYRARDKGHRSDTDDLYESLLAVGLRVEPITPSDVGRAADLIATSHHTAPTRTRGRLPTLSLGDGLCIAVAERLGLPLTGGDVYWETLDLRVPYAPFR